MAISKIRLKEQMEKTLTNGPPASIQCILFDTVRYTEHQPNLDKSLEANSLFLVSSERFYYACGDRPTWGTLGAGCSIRSLRRRAEWKLLFCLTQLIYEITWRNSRRNLSIMGALFGIRLGGSQSGWQSSGAGPGSEERAVMRLLLQPAGIGRNEMRCFTSAGISLQFMHAVRWLF